MLKITQSGQLPPENVVVVMLSVTVDTVPLVITEKGKRLWLWGNQMIIYLLAIEKDWGKQVRRNWKEKKKSAECKIYYKILRRVQRCFKFCRQDFRSVFQ